MKIDIEQNMTFNKD